MQQKVCKKEEGVKKDEKDRAAATENIINNLIKIVIKSFPEFAPPLKKLKIKRVPESINLTTDGYYLFYNYKKCRDSYKAYGYKQLLYQLMHTILHYISNDNVTAAKYEDKFLINTILDQKIHAVLLAIGIKNPENLCFGLLSRRKEYPHYSYYECIEDLNKRAQILSLRDEWKSDGHELWDYSLKIEEENEKIKRAWSNVREIIVGGDEDFLNGITKWINGTGKRNILYGDGTCDEIIQVHSLNKNKLCIDFEKDLSDFIVNETKTGANVNSIDLNLYTYGLKLYGDMPIVEPLDEDEDRKGLSGTLFVALDVSGSCIEVLDRFLNVICECLFYFKEYMGDKEVILIQFDAQIKSENHYMAADIYPGIFDNISTVGGGGTCFVEVFKRINKHIETGNPVSGAIFLSDGYGEFPKERVGGYPVLFVLPEEDSEVDLPEYVKTTVIKNV